MLGSVKKAWLTCPSAPVREMPLLLLLVPKKLFVCLFLFVPVDPRERKGMTSVQISYAEEGCVLCQSVNQGDRHGLCVPEPLCPSEGGVASLSVWLQLKWVWPLRYFAQVQ